MPIADPRPELKAIRTGKEIGPVPILGRSYRRFWEEERDLFKDMTAAWQSHPVFPWLSEVKGVAATLGCKLLGRLDPEKAPYASSFWAYCGLATVPGCAYRCDLCGLERSWPVGYEIKGGHVPLDAPDKSKKQCRGKLTLYAGPDDGIRTAPRKQKGLKRKDGSPGLPYDQGARTVMWNVGQCFVRLKDGGAYRTYYDQQRERLARERPNWNKGRQHMTALRITEKAFLAHLWVAWRTALDLPVSDPFPNGEGSVTDPWAMLG